MAKLLILGLKDLGISDYFNVGKCRFRLAKLSIFSLISEIRSKHHREI